MKHTAESLRQVDGSGVQEDEWVWEDAWFVNIASTIELRKRLKFHTTFFVKNNTNLYPMRVLHRLLKARYGEDDGNRLSS